MTQRDRDGMPGYGDTAGILKVMNLLACLLLCSGIRINIS